MRPSILFLTILLAFSISCQQQGKNGKKQDGTSEALDTIKLQGSLAIEGAYALTPFISACIDSFTSLHKEVTINLSSSSSGLALKNLTADKINLAMLSFSRSGSEIEPGLFYIGVAQDAVVPLINKNNPFYTSVLEKGITPAQFREIYSSGKVNNWPSLLDEEGNLNVKAYQRESGSGAAEVWANYLWSSPDDFNAEVVTGEDSMLSELHKNINAMGYCNLNYAYKWKQKNDIWDICIIPIDKNMDRKIERNEAKCLTIEEIHRSIWMGSYPRDLCRILSIVGKSDMQTELSIAFMKFLLNEGQVIAKNVNYCELNNVQLKNSVEKLIKVSKISAE